MKSRYFLIFCVLGFVVAMIIYPADVFSAAKSGLKAWLEIVFPALLPFFIASELMMAFGFVRFMGVLLEPVMRPLFNVPGAGAFVMAVGFTSGFPIGSHITAQLRKDRLCTRIEAERLICFTHNASPLFLLMVVPVGMFKSPALGAVIASGHYLANLTVGFLIRYYRRHDPEIIPNEIYQQDGLLRRAWNQMVIAQQKDRRPAGKLLGDAITNSVNKLLAIGGFVIVFAVIISIFNKVGIMPVLAEILTYLTAPFGLSPQAVPALTYGLFEVTLGTKAASEALAPFNQQVVAAAVCLAWSGLSVHAQVASMVSDTDIRLAPFFVARCCQAFLSGLYTLVLLNLSSRLLPTLTLPVFGRLPKAEALSWLEIIRFSSVLFTVTIISLTLLGIILSLTRTRMIRFRM